MIGSFYDENELFVHHHLGLGDHIICNGLIRELYSKVKKLNLFCKNNNIQNVSFMYKDLSNLNLVPISDDYEIYSKFKDKKVLRVGFEFSNQITKTRKVGWDESFYIQLNIPFDKRWNSFYIERDLIREDKLYKKLLSEGQKFALIHSSGSDGINRIDYSHINNSLHLIDINKNSTNLIFDYLTLIESAEEIHCIDSSFLHLVDSVKTKGSLFYHKNSKVRNPNEFHTQNKNWKII